MDPCTVIIAGNDVLPGLKQRASTLNGELLAFTDADALIALEVITKRRPGVVALEKAFAATPRGMALINRIKADPSLDGSEIRVMAHDSDYTRVLTRPGAAPAAPDASAATAATTSTATTSTAAASTATAAPAAPAAAATPAAPLDQRGTRRAPRYRIQGNVEVLIDGNTASVIDLSKLGAQVVSPTILKPNQRVRIALSDDLGNVRFNAAVAWASFEIPPKSGPRYRAGLEFVDADASAVDALCARHKT